MTFQRKTALRMIELVRSLRPDVQIVVGGYDPSLAPEAYMAEGTGVDFIVRGEGELTFRELLRAIEQDGGLRQNCRPHLSQRFGLAGKSGASRSQPGWRRYPFAQARAPAC